MYRILASAGCALAFTATASAEPYGPDAMTWRSPPVVIQHLPADGGSAKLPRGSTETDVWLLNADGQAVYRLRQRGSCFTRARARRCLVIRRGRTITSDATRYGAVVYGWQS